MEKIQIITNNNYYFGEKFKISSFKNPMSLDMYDINIIDLDRTGKGNEINFINLESDLNLLEKMIKGSTKTKFIFLFPQDGRSKIIYNRSIHTDETKKLVNDIAYFLGEELSYIFKYKDFFYENTQTKLNGEFVPASFYLKISDPNDKVLFKSEKSEKITAILSQFGILTTLKLTKEKEFIGFIEKVFKKEEGSIPEWFNEIEAFDDKEKKSEILEQNSIINTAKIKIENNNKILDENNYYKSILYSTGDELVEVVFKILGQMLNYNLEEFKDENKEDFLIKLKNITFVGEIKGVSGGLKSQYIAQTEKHLRCYTDDKAEDNENCKGILIVNPQRQKKIKERDIIHNNEKNLSKKYGVLVILTKDLLQLFEKFKNKEITTEKIKEILKNTEGLLTLDK